MIAPCCCVCMCVHDVSPNSTTHHSRDRTVICHHTTHCARARLPREPCGERQLLHVGDEQQPRPTGMQHSAADGRTCGSEHESHPRRRSPEWHVRTANRGGGGEEGWRVEMWFEASVRRRRGIQDAQTHGSEGTGSNHSPNTFHGCRVR